MKTSWIFWPATAEKPQGLWLRLAELETKYGNAESLDNVGTPGVALKKRGNDGWWARAPGLQWWDFYGIHISIIYVYNTYICIYIWYMYTVIRTSSGWIWWWPHVVTSVDWGNHHLKWLQILARYHGGCELTIWLVVSNMFYFPFHIRDNPSHWLRFFKMVIAPPTSKWEYQGISIGRICSST